MIPARTPYGHWDSYAIISFVFALFLPVPVASCVDGRHRHVAYQKTAYERARAWRGRGDHHVLYTIAVIWMTIHGISPAPV